MLMMKWYKLGWFVKMIAKVMTLLMMLRADRGVIDVRRNLAEVCRKWYPVVFSLHRFFTAVAWTVLNNDGSGEHSA